MPPRKLTAEQAKFVQDAGHDMFTYEEAAEHHTAILRKIPINEYAAAYEQCAKIAAPMGFRPDQHNLAKCVADSKSALAKECTTPIEHIQAMSAAMFLAQTIGAQAADFHGKYLLPEVMKVRTELMYVVWSLSIPYSNVHLAENKIRLPPTPPTWPGPCLPPSTRPWQLLFPPPQPPRTPPPVSPLSESQPTIICPVFDFAPFASYPRVPVTPEQIAAWKLTPEPLQDEIFVTADEDGEEEAFVLHSYTRARVGVGRGTAGKEYIYYVLVAGEDEAIGYRPDAFFDLLGDSHVVVQP